MLIYLMDNWIIAIIAVIVVIALLILCFLHIKKKIRNKIIDTGADIIKKTTGNILNDETAGIVNEAADVTAKILKGGKKELIKIAAQKGWEATRGKRDKNKADNPSEKEEFSPDGK